MLTKAQKQGNSEGDLRKNNLHRLAVGYARVSTPRQGESGISADAQRVGIQEYAEHVGFTLIEIFDDVASGVGAKSFANRDGLRRALDMAVRDNARLIVWDWDRLSRHSQFKEQILEYISDLNRVICAKHGADMRDAAKHATFKHTEAVAAEISRRTKEGMKKKREEGVVFGNPDIRTKVQPLGTSTWSEISKKQDQAIADVLRDLPDPFAPTYAEVADLLNSKYLRTLQKNEWNKSRVRQPVERARAILRQEEEMQQESHPRFGMF